MKYLKLKIYENNLTIKEIAKKHNISEQTITNWINNRNISTILNFLKITLYLNFTSKDYNKLYNSTINEKKEP